jgi:TPR repeat protein
MRRARVAAEAGSAEAQALLAFILSSGPPDLRDLDQADLWYERSAAAGGLPAALYLLGVITERGLGATRNEAAAAESYRGAAEKGHRSGQARGGKALMHGIGVDANPSEGQTWLRRAALAGDPEAATALGDLYAAGENLLPNHAEQVGFAVQPRPATRARRARLASFIFPAPASRKTPSRACGGSASPLHPGTNWRAPSSAIFC